jgi:hypothetical protein
MHDGQLCVLRVVLIAQNDISYIHNHALVICSAIDIVDGDWLSEGACGDVIELCPLDVNETSSGTTVNEGLSASSGHGIH